MTVKRLTKRQLHTGSLKLAHAIIHLMEGYRAAWEKESDAAFLLEDYGDSFDAALETLRECRKKVEAERILFSMRGQKYRPELLLKKS
jgi:hypothetical protein